MFRLSSTGSTFLGDAFFGDVFLGATFSKSAFHRGVEAGALEGGWFATPTDVTPASQSGDAAMLGGDVGLVVVVKSGTLWTSLRIATS
jgi:hypothetical protein